MRVTLFGGTGFVGRYLVDALLAAGMHPVLLVRPGSERRTPHADRCTLVSGKITDADAVAHALQEADAAIYNIGILREYPQRGVTFDALHFEGARRTMDAAAAAGTKRYLLMSANGVKADGTGYQQTKYMAEQYLATTALDWTIFRPSVIFGDPHGHMEFATRLLRDIVNSPAPAPLFYDGLLPMAAGGFQMSPVHANDVARAFVTALQKPETAGRILPLGGPDALSWRALLTTIAAAVGKTKLMLPVPAWGVAAAAALCDRFEAFPVTRDQIRMLMEGNTCSAAVLRELDIDPTPFNTANLAYLTAPEPERHPWQQNVA